MTELFTPPRLPDDPDEITDLECVEYMKEVKSNRLTRGIPLARFVRGLAFHGYALDHATYKRMEDAPFYASDHIRDGFLTYAYKVLNATRTAVTDSEQGAYTDYATRRLAGARIELGLSHKEAARKITQAGFPCTGAEWRTTEQGITRKVEFEMILCAAAALGVPIPELFEEL